MCHDVWWMSDDGTDVPSELGLGGVWETGLTPTSPTRKCDWVSPVGNTTSAVTIVTRQSATTWMPLATAANSLASSTRARTFASDHKKCHAMTACRETFIRSQTNAVTTLPETWFFREKVEPEVWTTRSTQFQTWPVICGLNLTHMRNAV